MEEKYKDTISRIKPFADSFIEKNNLSYPLKDSVTILSDMGYYIIKANAPNNLSGFYMQKDRYPFIFVNASHSLGRQNFSLWHEIYHHIMQHQNGISDFGSNAIEEREAEIFAGVILLPDKEIEKWDVNNDLKDPNVLAQMSVYYQMSFSAVVIRVMQFGILDFKIFNDLKRLSFLEYRDELHAIYNRQNLSISILKSTNDIKISPNIMSILQSNYKNNLINADKINEIISKIEVLNYEQS